MSEQYGILIEICSECGDEHRRSLQSIPKGEVWERRRKTIKTLCYKHRSQALRRIKHSESKVQMSVEEFLNQAKREI